MPLLLLPLLLSATGIIAIDLARQMLQMLPNTLTVYDATVAAAIFVCSRHHRD
jgi:hypothetical protein